VELSISSDVDSLRRRVVSLTGSLDLASRDQLRQVAADALATVDVPALVLNLAGVGFVDSAGIGAVIEVARDAEDAAVPFILQDPSERVMRVLTISGLLDAWPVENSASQ
jgi:anti-sigma B factor antagonist